MKKSIIFAITLIAATSCFSAQIKCAINMNVVSKIGLMPTNLTTVWQTEIQNRTEIGSIEKCSSYQIANQQTVSFCSFETAVPEVFDVTAFVFDGIGVNMTRAISVVGRNINKSKNLVQLHSEDMIFDSFKNKMKDLGLTSPDVFHGDSLGLDDVIEAANKISPKSLLGTPVTLGIYDCELLK